MDEPRRSETILLIDDDTLEARIVQRVLRDLALAGQLVCAANGEQGLAYLESLPDVEGLIFTAAAQVVYTPGMESLLCKVEPEGYPQ